MPTLTVQYTRSLPADNTYSITAEIINAVDIPFAVFVFDEDHQMFRHVASVYDIDNFPTSQAQANTDNLAYYRGKIATVTFDNVRDATAWQIMTSDRLQVLAVAWSSVSSAFTGIDVVTING